MQKSDATPGSLQNPVSDQFWDHFGRGLGRKIHPKLQKRVPKAHAKKRQIFDMRKNRKKWTPETKSPRPAACAAPLGGLGGCIYTCKSLHAMNLCKDFMQRFYAKIFTASSTPAGAADLIASRIPPGRVQLGCWVVGSLACWVVGVS